MKTRQPINEITSSQGELVKIFFIAVFLTIGINLLTNQISTLQNPFFAFIAGIVLIFISIVYLTQIFVTNKRKMHEEFGAFLVYNKESNLFEDVPEYHFSWDAIEYMKAAFVENINLNEFWKTKPLNYDNFPIRSDLRKFVNELTEYCILRTLFTQNEGFFNAAGFNESDKKRIERDDIPELLIKNRFLELISKPMSERALFNFEEESNDHGTVVSASGENGALYNRCALYLPKKCTILKPKDNVVLIDSDLMTISITSDFRGFGYNMPAEFLKRYLKIDDENETVSVYGIKIIVDITFKAKSLLSQGDLKYYLWVDEFMRTLDDYLSGETFFKRIGWNSAMTIIRCLDNTKYSPKDE
jgi:hypothetical protein